ncbi:MAG: ABC transporter substrate-binding protein [Roseburia sp.]|nr:ABC transporter substrate-binding protein [Roseburia sp.]
MNLFIRNQKKQTKNKIIRLLCLILQALLLTAFLSGCGSQGAQSADKMRVGALKGPTTMGLLFLMEDAAQGNTKNQYDFQMATGADELLSRMVKGQLDIALIPANVASVLYQKTEGEVCVIAVNTLGVLYLTTGDEAVQHMEDLEGRTVYLTGKGTTPDYVLQYLLEKNEIRNCKLEYKSEATEVAAILAEKPGEIGLLPQPFVTAACMQNDKLSAVVSLNEEWNAVQEEPAYGMVTGVTVVRRAFLEENPEAVKSFLEEHKNSVQSLGENPDKAAALCVEAGIVAKEAVAQKAIPECNITCITGEAMKEALESYLQVLYERAPESVGGSMPGADFYSREQ